MAGRSTGSGAVRVAFDVAFLDPSCCLWAPKFEPRVEASLTNLNLPHSLTTTVVSLQADRKVVSLSTEADPSNT
eukprot:1309116-Amphidinium_carterae.1